MNDEKFCDGTIEFRIDCSEHTLTGFVKIPKEEYSVSDDDFEVWYYADDGAVESCDYHGFIPNSINDFLCDDIFLEIVCDNAHLEEYSASIKFGHSLIFLQLWNDGFEWDVKE